jgi:hypothetical protein
MTPAATKEQPPLARLKGLFPAVVKKSTESPPYRQSLVLTFVLSASGGVLIAIAATAPG